jgi:hypothetical protein
MTQIKIKTKKADKSSRDIPEGQIFTGKICFDSSWLFKKISINGISCIISLAGNNDWWESELYIEDYQPIEFVEFVQED